MYWQVKENHPNQVVQIVNQKTSSNSTNSEPTTNTTFAKMDPKMLPGVDPKLLQSLDPKTMDALMDPKMLQTMESIVV